MASFWVSSGSWKAGVITHRCLSCLQFTYNNKQPRNKGYAQGPVAWIQDRCGQKMWTQTTNSKWDHLVKARLDSPTVLNTKDFRVLVSRNHKSDGSPPFPSPSLANTSSASACTLVSVCYAVVRGLSSRVFSSATSLFPLPPVSGPMSRWLFPWSGSIKKRACRYLLQHYLGHFLQERLSLDQLGLDLYNGSGVIRDINLDVWVSVGIGLRLSTFPALTHSLTPLMFLSNPCTVHPPRLFRNWESSSSTILNVMCLTFTNSWNSR